MSQRDRDWLEWLTRTQLGRSPPELVTRAILTNSPRARTADVQLVTQENARLNHIASLISNHL